MPDPAEHSPTACWPPAGSPGDGTLELLLEHADAVGREAARRAARVAHRRQASLPTRCECPSSNAGVHGRPRADPRTAARPATRSCSSPARTHGGFVDFSEDVSEQGHRHRGAGGLRLRRAGQALHDRDDGPRAGKARDGQHGGPGRGGHRPQHRGHRRPDVAADVRTGQPGCAGRADQFEPVRHSPMQPWHARHGAVPLVAGQWIRPDHYGDPAAEVRAVRERSRDHRRHPDRQARPARARRSGAAEPAVRQQLVQARRRAGCATA